MRRASGDVRGPHRFKQKRPPANDTDSASRWLVGSSSSSSSGWSSSSLHSADHRIGAAGLCCGRDVKKSTFAEFLVPFDFRLLQQYRSKTEVSGLARHVRFTLWSRYRQPAPACPFGARKRLMRCNKRDCYSITSSARSKIDCGKETPIAFAVLRFTTNSNLVGCSIGNAAGLVPLTILST